MFQASLALGQPKTIHLSGQVSDEKGQPICHANISIKKSKVTIQTNEQGEYRISSLQNGNYTLQVSYIGKKESKYFLSLHQDTVLNFTLLDQVNHLAEVIINPSNIANTSPISIGKMPCQAMDIPQSMSVIDGTTIKKEQAMRLSDAIQYVNGINLAAVRGGSWEVFYARGYIACCNNMLKNGARVPADVMSEMSSLEKLEILKGSAAVLYGHVTPGGVINMVTKQPKFEQGGSLTMRTGSHDLYKPEIDVYGPINTKIAYRINGTYELAGSFRDQVNTKRYYANPSLLFKPNNKTEILFQGDYLKHQFTPDFGTGVINNEIINLPRTTFLGTSWSNATTEHTNISIALKHQLNNSWQLNANATYQIYQRNYQATENIQPQPNGDWDRPLGKYQIHENRHAGQINLNGKLKTGQLEHTLLIGTDAERFLNTNYTYTRLDYFNGSKEKVWTHLDENNVLQSGYDRINIWDPNKYTPRVDIPSMNPFDRIVTTTNRFGFYTNDLITISEKVNILAGLRWSYIHVLPITTTDLRTQIISERDAKTDHAFSPRLGLVYKPSPNTSLFMSYANSFLINYARDFNGNTLKPSLIDQYESGVKHNFLQGKLIANVTAYRIINNNLAQTARFAKDGITPNNDLSIKELTGQTKSDGLEIDLTGRPLKGLNILAGYSYNFMRYTQTPDTPGSYLVGDRIVNIPDHTANASIWYEFNDKKLRGLSLGVSAKYIGERLAGWNRTVGGNKQPFSVPGFTTVNLSMGYSYKRFSFIGKISNINNTLNYYVHENYSVNPITPRQFSTTLSYKL